MDVITFTMNTIGNSCNMRRTGQSVCNFVWKWRCFDQEQKFSLATEPFPYRVVARVCVHNSRHSIYYTWIIDVHSFDIWGCLLKSVTTKRATILARVLLSVGKRLHIYNIRSTLEEFLIDLEHLHIDLKM